jgi:hypothetical protein
MLDFVKLSGAFYARQGQIERSRIKARELTTLFASPQKALMLLAKFYYTTRLSKSIRFSVVFLF